MTSTAVSRQCLAWARGVVTVEALGGMIGATSFVLPDGRQVSPLHIAPWFADPLDPEVPGVLRGLRGEWPCVPFGADAPRNLPPGWAGDGETFAGAEEPHGPSSNETWEFVGQGGDAINLRCVYPEGHPISVLHRSVRPDPAAAALDITLRVEARRACRLPIGLHPTLRLPMTGLAELVPPAFAMGWVFPLQFEPSSQLLPGANFRSLEAVPALSGGMLSIKHLPLAGQTEELVQLSAVDGDFVLRYPGEGFQVRLSWNTAHFPSVTLWVSNRGRSYAPWNGRHLALGIEPICSAFDLGPAVSCGANPIAASGTATAMDFAPGRDFVTTYRIAVEPLEGW